MQTGGVQKLSGAVFCKRGTGEKLTINILSNQWRIGITEIADAVFCAKEVSI